VSAFGGFRRKAAVLLRRERFDSDLDEEIRAHLEMQAEEYRSNGMAAPEALASARRTFGNPVLAAEQSRELWSSGTLETLARDVRYAFRVERRNPVLAAVVVLVLALGIGGATTVFSLINALLLNPFPYPHAGRLVAIQSRRNHGTFHATVPIRDYFDWRGQNTVFEEMAAYGWARANVAGGGEPERLVGGTATHGLLRVLGVPPALGRFFAPGEDMPGGAAVVVLSHGFWERAFGARPDILGRTIEINSRAYTVIGIMPSRLPLPGMLTPEFWVPACYNPSIARGNFMDGDFLIARLKPGVPLERAHNEIAWMARRFEREYPDTNRGLEPRVVPIGRELAEGASRFLYAPTLAAALVLLVTCANLAGLLLARGAAREREMAVRASLGAGRGRLLRQGLTETVLLSLLGGLLAVALARTGIRFVVAAAPPNLGLDSALRIDAGVLTFSAALTIAAGIGFGLAPAWRASRTGFDAVLKGAAKASASRPRSRFLSGLLVAEVAVALVLLIGGGLLAKSLSRMLMVDLGIRTERVLTFRIGLSGWKYRSDASRARFLDELMERLRAIPGVRAAGAVSPLPLSREYSGGPIRIDDRPAPERWQDMSAQHCEAAAGYFEALGIPILEGHDFSANDRSARAAVIVNRALARRYFPGESALGHHVNGAEIVGVIGDVRHDGPATPPGPQVYRLLVSPWGAAIAVRTAGGPEQAIAAVRAEVRALDPHLPLDRIKPMEQVVSDSLAEAKLIGVMMGGFAAFAAAMAALGIYGTVAYAVSQRSHEIGIRLALGATPARITGLMLRKGVMLAAVGVALGVPAALAASRVIRSLLFQVEPYDTAVYAGLSAVLLAVAMTASYLPARRAARLGPLEAIRRE
jgi:putative ABC transport system permease protein